MSSRASRPSGVVVQMRSRMTTARRFPSGDHTGSRMPVGPVCALGESASTHNRIDVARRRPALARFLGGVIRPPFLLWSL